MKRPSAIVLILILSAMALSSGCSSRGGESSSRAVEMQEGYKAAKHGYWQEARMRFERARSFAPQDADVLNNLAVALEAVGEFEAAKKTYEEARRLDPGDDKLKKNIRQFEDFYATYIAGKAGTGDEESNNE